MLLTYLRIIFYDERVESRSRRWEGNDGAVKSAVRILTRSLSDVSGFPTLKWFVNGKAQDYGGGRTADTIVSWVSKRMGPPTKALQTT